MHLILLIIIIILNQLEIKLQTNFDLDRIQSLFSNLSSLNLFNYLIKKKL